MKFIENDTVKLVRDIPDKGLKKGLIGAVVAVYNVPKEAFEVEFIDECGKTIHQSAFLANELEKIT